MGVDFGAVFVLIVTVNQKLKSAPNDIFDIIHPHHNIRRLIGPRRLTKLLS